MFLQAGDGVMSPSELTVGWNLHVSRPCDANGYLTLSRIVLLMWPGSWSSRVFVKSSLLHLPSLRHISMCPVLSPHLFHYPTIWAWSYSSFLPVKREFSLVADCSRCYVYKTEFNQCKACSSVFNRQDILVFLCTPGLHTWTFELWTPNLRCARWSALWDTWLGKVQLHIGAQLAGCELAIGTVLRSKWIMIPSVQECNNRGVHTLTHGWGLNVLIAK